MSQSTGKLSIRHSLAIGWCLQFVLPNDTSTISMDTLTDSLVSLLENGCSKVYFYNTFSSLPDHYWPIRGLRKREDKFCSNQILSQFCSIRIYYLNTSISKSETSGTCSLQLNLTVIGQILALKRVNSNRKQQSYSFNLIIFHDSLYW